MKSDAVKLELIEWLAKVDDEGLLKALMLLKKSSQEPDWFDTLTPEQALRVEQGIEDYKKGRTVKSKKVWEKYEKKG
jgi:phage terminase large subunit GpA-like protein